MEVEAFISCFAILAIILLVTLISTFLNATKTYFDSCDNPTKYAQFELSGLTKE